LIALKVFATTTAALIGIACVGSYPAKALWIGESEFYSWSEEICTAADAEQVDPVGVVFQGSHANGLGAAKAVQSHAGWAVATGDKQGLFVNMFGGGNYGCRSTTYQRASGSLGRFHIRLWFIPASKEKPKLKTVGTPHHEDVVAFPPCGHAVDSNGPTGSGFDWGRREVSERMFEGGHVAQINQYWGNTANFKQCDGDWAGSNGTGVRIPLNHAH